MSQEDFEQFRRVVLQDRSLQEKLRSTADMPSFVALVVRLGEERDHRFTAEDVQAAMAASRRAWIERWV
ncbi:MAG: Nif11-like leader peptide family natural product precursor [Kouleothrix sp.]|nr:Nif11-like leader peptide family natural product precursor [Kouleothrix sp.]